MHAGPFCTWPSTLLDSPKQVEPDSSNTCIQQILQQNVEAAAKVDNISLEAVRPTRPVLHTHSRMLH